MPSTLPDPLSLSARTLQNARRGALPTCSDGKLWVGHGSGKICSGCGESIKSTEQELEKDYSDTVIFRFHCECYEAWATAADEDDDDASA